MMSLSTRRPMLAVALSASLLSGHFPAPLRAAPPGPPAAAPGAPTILHLLGAPNFWDLAVASDARKIDASHFPAIRKLATTSENPVVRLRASVLVMDLDGNRRIAPGLNRAAADKAMATAMKHLEANLRDPAVASLGPEDGLSHATIVHRPDDAAGIFWVLLEQVAPINRGGLNIRVDTAAGVVREVTPWGVERPDKTVEAARAALTDAKEALGRAQALFETGATSLEGIRTLQSAVARAELKFKITTTHDPAERAALTARLAHLEAAAGALAPTGDLDVVRPRPPVERVIAEEVITRGQIKQVDGRQVTLLTPTETGSATLPVTTDDKTVFTLDGKPTDKAPAVGTWARVSFGEKSGTDLAARVDVSSAAPSDWPVDVRILTSVTADDLKKPGTEPWVDAALASAGIKHSQPTSGWVTLSEDQREVYASMAGGRLIKGSAHRAGGKVIVRLEGFAMGKTPRDIVLSDRANEGTVIKLTDYPGDRNVYAAVRVGLGG